MPTAAGVRITWPDLPSRVRAAVEEILGSPVTAYDAQSGGFSPGTADRVVTRDDDRAFVKAVGVELNEGSPGLHRREAAVSARLPSDPRIPALLGCYDDGDWVALVLEDVEGRHPTTPWVAAELDRVLKALSGLAAVLTPNPVAHLRSARDELTENFQGWSRVVASPPEELDPWAARHLGRLVDLSAVGVRALGGDTVVHVDLRADNLLLRPDGSVAVVDWPWACVGPAWLDTVLLLVNVELFGGHDTDALLESRVWPAGAGPTRSEVTAVLAGVAGYFVDAARLPPPAGLPTVRAFQQAQAVSTLAWVRRRLTAS